MNPYKKVVNPADFHEDGIEILNGEQFVPLSLTSIGVNESLYVPMIKLHAKLHTAQVKLSKLNRITAPMMLRRATMTIIQDIFRASKDIVQIRAKLRELIKAELREFYQPLDRFYTIAIQKNFCGLGNISTNQVISPTTQIRADLFLKDGCKGEVRYRAGEWFTQYGVNGKLCGQNYTPIRHKHYKLNQPTFFCSDGMNSLHPEILLVVKAKHVPMIRFRNVLSRPTKLPISDMKLLIQSGYAISSVSEVIVTHLDALRISGLLVESVPVQVVKNFLYKEAPNQTTADYMKNVLTHIE